MNAPTTAAALAPSAPLADPTLEFLPLANIAPSRTQVQGMRRARYNKDKLHELADSIRSLGRVAQPIVVRPHPTPTALTPYELVAGERRWIAAKIAGLAHIHATVQALTDDQALGVQLVENLQREGLHELEEAEGYAELMRLHQATGKAVAAMVGRSNSYVNARLKLLTLQPDARAKFYAGELDASRALYVARIALPKLQAKALVMATEKYGERFRHSVRELKRAFDGKGFTISLKTAPFDTTDATLAPHACTDCEHRTGNCTDLFTEVEDPDVCTNTPCFHKKVKAHGTNQRSAAIADGRAIITGEAAKKIAPRKDVLVGYVDLDQPCDWDHYAEPEPEAKNDAERESPEFERKQQAWDDAQDAYRPRSYRQLLQGEALKTELLEDPKTGQLRELINVNFARGKLKQAGIALPGYVGEKPREASQSGGFNSKKYEEEQARREEREQAELAYRRALLIAAAEKLKGPLKHADLVDVADTLLSEHGVKAGLKVIYTAVPEPGKLTEEGLAKFIRIALVAESVTWAGQPIAPLLALAKQVKVDPAKIRAALRAPATAAAATATPAKTSSRKAQAKPTKKPKTKRRTK